MQQQPSNVQGQQVQQGPVVFMAQPSPAGGYSATNPAGAVSYYPQGIPQVVVVSECQVVVSE